MVSASRVKCLVLKCIYFFVNLILGQDPCLRSTLLSLLSEYPSYTDSDNMKRSDDKHLSFTPILFITNLLYLYIKMRKLIYY